MAIEWNDQYKLGIIEIDDQHKILINLIGELEKAILEKNESKVLIEIWERLIEYTQIHFYVEEEYFRKHNYGGRSEHCRQHQTFIKNLTEYLPIIDSHDNDSITAENLLKLLNDWLVHHILNEDAKYISLFKANGVR